jgi:hypothetical protein
VARACDPHTQLRLGQALFPRLTADGYTLAQPKGDWSYHAGKNARGGTRADHALASPALHITDARYLYKAGRHLLAGAANGTTALSDHALLSIRVPRLPAHAHPPTMHRKCIAHGHPARP